MTTEHRPETPARPAATHRRLRRTAVGITAGLAVLYAVLFLLVRDAERGQPENTFGAYLFLTITYLVGVGALALRDQRPVYAAGAAVQVAVLVLFVLFAVGGEHAGVFDYEALDGLYVEAWATVITTAQVVLLGLLSALAVLTAPQPRAGHLSGR